LKDNKKRIEKQATRVGNSFIVVERVIHWKSEEQFQAGFILTWSINEVKSAGDKFHKNFQAGLWTHPLGYRGVNLGYIIEAHK
jgi:hypothetical protein